KSFTGTVPEIIILLNVAVFMQGQVFLPGKIAEFKNIGAGYQVIFTSERGQTYITIGQRGLIMKHDIDFSYTGADGKRGIGGGFENEGSDTPGLFSGCRHINDPHGIRIDLLPFKIRGKSTKLLGGKRKTDKNK